MRRRFFALLALSFLAACGSSDGGGEGTGSHTYPAWLEGDWQVMRINIGFGSDNVESHRMLFAVDQTKFVYVYPECRVQGKLVMDASVPAWAAYTYLLVMQKVDCARQWDIDTVNGNEDIGYIWRDPDPDYFYRTSFYYDVMWVYYRWKL